MTCEISIMNRHAIVLAADSAATVPYWSEVEQEWKERYFKGANKIFQLSMHHPVGIMIYGTASLHEVPWEVIVKDFRSRLGDKSFNDVTAYADEFFTFIRNHTHLFPADYQGKIFRDETDKVAFRQLMDVRGDDSVVKAGTEEEKKAAALAIYDRVAADIEAMQIAAPFDQGDLDSALGKYRADVEAEIQKMCVVFDSGYVDAARAAELAIRRLFKRPTDLMQVTGVVVAGYGDHDYFPRSWRPTRPRTENSCRRPFLGKVCRCRPESRVGSRCRDRRYRTMIRTSVWFGSWTPFLFDGSCEIAA